MDADAKDVCKKSEFPSNFHLGFSGSETRCESASHTHARTPRTPRTGTGRAVVRSPPPAPAVPFRDLGDHLCETCEGVSGKKRGRLNERTWDDDGVLKRARCGKGVRVEEVVESLRML